ncbi:MAG TPA: SDR family oxidoreductase [Erythrobacter sp.]
MHLKPLDQQTIVITGGSSGIGLATARLAAERGANVVIIARSQEGLEAAAAPIRAEGWRCDTVQADVGSREDVSAAIEEVLARHGSFDTFVSNAGVGAYALLEEISDADHRQVFETNYWGTVHCATEALPHLKAHGGALIVTGSIASDMPSPVLSAYTASKHAVKGYVDSLRLELMHEKAPVSVTLIQPSGINSPFVDKALNQMEARAMIPPPIYSPDLVAEAILHAAQHPTRGLMVGGGGRAMTLFGKLLPNLADRVFQYAFFSTAIDKDKPPQNTGAKGFRTGGGEGKVYGELPMRRTSLYTFARLNPLSALAGAVLAAGAAGAMSAALRRR